MKLAELLKFAREAGWSRIKENDGYVWDIENYLEEVDLSEHDAEYVLQHDGRVVRVKDDGYLESVASFRLMKDVSVERVDIREDFPNRDEAYAILRGEDGRYAFAWGPKLPYADVVPAQDVRDGESGIEWYDSEENARAAMDAALEAWNE